MSLPHEQEYDRRVAGKEAMTSRPTQAWDAQTFRARAAAEELLRRGEAAIKTIEATDIDPAALTKRPDAERRTNDHVEIRRRLLERAEEGLVKAQAEFVYARDGLRQLLPEAEHTEVPALTVPSPLSDQVGGDHYKKMVIQVVEFVDKNQIPYLEGNAIKYICRHADKGGVQDIDKAIHYLQLLKELRYGTAE